jgi:hypothetical protein
LLRCHGIAVDAAIETISRAKSRLFHTVASNLSRELDVEVPFTKEAVERRHRLLTGVGENVTTADPFETNDEFDELARQRQVTKQAEVLNKEAKEAEEIAKAEHKKIQRALEAKRLAEAEVAKAEAILKKVSKTSKAKIEAAARKRADAGRATSTPSETPKKKKKAPAQLKLHTSGLNYAADDDEASAPPSPSPLGSRMDAKKNVGVDPKDPRRHLTVNELEALCGTHGLIKTGSKAALMTRLRDHDNSLAIEKVQSILSEHAMSTTGDRAALLERLAFVDATKSNWGRRISLVTEDDISPHRSPRTPTKMALPSRTSTPQSATFPHNGSFTTPAKQTVGGDQTTDRPDNKRARTEQLLGQQGLLTPHEEDFEKESDSDCV